MPATQLDITNSFDKQALDRRKQRISNLRSRANTLIKDWQSIFGTADTPVPIDRAWHNLTLAMEAVQGESQFKSRIAMAEEQLDQAEWIVEAEQQ